MQESEKEQEGGPSDCETVSDSVPVRPGTSAESAEVPAVMVNEELDSKEADSGLCHHDRVAITEQLKQSQ